MTDGSHNPPPKREEGYPVISASNIKKRSIDLSIVIRYCDQAGFDKENPRTRITRGDLILGIIGGSIGNVGIYDSDESVIAQRSVAIIATFGVNPFISWVLESPLFQGYYRNASGTAQGGIYLATISSMLVPLPPLAEQRRIVERVSELMPLVDEYRLLQDEREALDEQLPERLRRSILQQSVEGRLVPQDPKDEPASELLAHIREERHELIRQKKLKPPKGGESVIYRASDGRRYEKRGKGEPVCIDDEIPFDIPDSWEWARLGSIASVNSGLGYKKPDLNVQGERMIRVLRGGNIGDGRQPLIKDSDIMISAQFVEDSLILHDGQIITPAVTSLDNVAKAALIENSDGNTVCGGFVFCITPYLSDKVFSGFMYYCLSAPFHVSFCRGSVKKSGQAFYNLSKTALSSALIPLPPLAEQRRIVERVQELFKLIA